MEANRHIFLGFVPYALVHPLFFRLRGISGFFSRLFPDLDSTLTKARMDFTVEDYVSYSLINYFCYAVVFGGLLAFIGFNSRNPLFSGDVVRSSLIGFVGFFTLLAMLVVLMSLMPKMQAKRISKNTDKMLLYAMKDLLLQVSSGTSLYASMVVIAESNYGEVSRFFDRAVRKINVGLPMKDVLESMIAQTDSEYMKRALWQMITSLRAGADLRRTLGSVIEELNNDQKNQIMSYSRESNLWSLFYMLFAVAIPTIGSTMLVILSTFAGFGLSRVSFIVFIVVCFFIQILLVMFVKTRRPVVQF